MYQENYGVSNCNCIITYSNYDKGLTNMKPSKIV